MQQWRKEWSPKEKKGKPLCKHWNCYSWQKGMSRDKATLNSTKIKPKALAVIKLRMFDGISK